MIKSTPVPEHTADYISKNFKEKPAGEALAETLDILFNSFGCDTMAQEAADIITTKTHRTIQQNITRGVFIYLRTLAKQEYFDARNESSVMAARAAIKAIDDEHIGFPLI